MTGRVLILTAAFGEGHNAAARALQAGFRREAGDIADVVDIFAMASPRTNEAARRFYLTLINKAPRLWSRVYDWIDRTHLVQRQLWLFRAEIRTLANLLERERPVAICCTYPLYGFFLAEITRQGGFVPPTYNVVTDSISIHSLWWRAGGAGWFLPNEDSACVLRSAGVSSELIHVSGFPVPAFFAENAAKLTPPDLALGSTPRVLHIINSGTRHAEETAQRLLTETSWHVTCAVGRDTRLEAKLARLARIRSQPAEILGWTDRIPSLLMTHHVVVSKAGGATTQEAIAAQCPMIVSQVVPGQEEGNYELLRRHQVGALAESPQAVMTELAGAFAHSGAVWQKWRAALRRLGRADAAGDIARHVMARVRPQAARGQRPNAMSVGAQHLAASSLPQVS
jgi:processive 1,2-diacylglycerol beta-glucosyltransferase